jgi:hypothetical protein
VWTLLASFFWGTVGLAFFIYGKKAGEMLPLSVGLVLMVISYFLSAVWLSVVSIVLITMFWIYVRENG